MSYSRTRPFEGALGLSLLAFRVKNTLIGGRAARMSAGAHAGAAHEKSGRPREDADAEVAALFFAVLQDVGLARPAAAEMRPRHSDGQDGGDRHQRNPRDRLGRVERQQLA
jgi:hypothetical protein